MTDKDRQDLMFGLDQGVDWVALSFVRNPHDVLEIKELIASAGKQTPVIVKIEKHEAIEQMEAILSLSDGVMVARGDLGVELPAEDVPIQQIDWESRLSRQPRCWTAWFTHLDPLVQRFLMLPMPSLMAPMP
jgi:pyruvate kinase